MQEFSVKFHYEHTLLPRSYFDIFSSTLQLFGHIPTDKFKKLRLLFPQLRSFSTMEGDNLQRSNSVDIENLQELIKPIRELSAVWDIPLGNYLDSFLNNLNNVDFSQNFSPEMLNFSQAGLFLQGSTNILAKKVKHLYDLATSSLSFDTLEADDENHHKRKRKTFEWTVDDKLANIEDPDIVETLKTVDDSQIRIEITTMPKIPFCLLHSLEAQTDKRKRYRIDSIPDEDYSIILLDPNQDLRSLGEPSGRRMVDFNLPNEQDGMFPPPMIQPQITENGEEEEIKEKDKESKDNDEENENKDNDEEKENNQEREKVMQFMITSDDDMNNFGPIRFLDPDSPAPSILLRPVKKLKKHNIPKSFQDSKTKKQSLKKPFHNNIFQELFEQVKEYRRQKEHVQKIQEISAISEENGREHIINEMDSYQEDLQQDDYNDLGFNNDFIQDSPPLPQFSSPNFTSLNNLSYIDLCRNMIQKMIEMGEKKVQKTRQNKILSEWEAKIEPILENNLKKKAFSIDECEEWILDMIKSHNGKVTFDLLKSGLESHEISRIFFTTLDLANKRKLKLDDNVQTGTNFNIEIIE